MIDLHGVSFRYGWGAATALREVSLSVGGGEVVGVLGVNGAGKSTLLRLCAGLTRAASGLIAVDGARMRDAIRRRVAYAPDSGGVYSFLTTSEAGELLARELTDWDRDRFAELSRLLDLPASRPAARWSRGQRARLRLAQALARRAPVLVLDEPLAGIDPASRQRIVESLADDLANAPRTVLLSTHEVSEVEALFDRVVVLEDGVVTVDRPADDLRQETGGSLDAFVRAGGRP